MYGTELALSPATTKSSMRSSLGGRMPRLVLPTLGGPSSRCRCRRSAAVGLRRRGILGSMSRRPRREHPTERHPEADERGLGAAPLDGRLVGYRLIRRIASGDRADVYLAALGRSEASDADGAVGADMADSTRVAAHGIPSLVVLRVYGAEADDDAITRELEAMSTDAAGALPRLHDVAT